MASEVSRPRTAKKKRLTTTKKRSSGGRVKYVYRYNPESTSGRAVRVRADSPEAAEWPSRKPSAAFRHARKELIQTGGKIAGTVAAGLAGAALNPATRAVVRAGVGAAARGAAAALGGSVAAAGAGTVVATVGAAFAVGFAIGTGLRALWHRYSPEERNFRRAMAFRAARQKWERDTGEPMSTEQVQAMGQGFKQSLQRTAQFGGA